MWYFTETAVCASLMNKLSKTIRIGNVAAANVLTSGLAFVGVDVLIGYTETKAFYKPVSLKCAPFQPLCVSVKANVFCLYHNNCRHSFSGLKANGYC